MLSRIAQISLALIALAILLPPPLLGQTKTKELSQKTTLVRIPFVGCRADGQLGPIPAPKGAGKVVQLPAETVQRLAFYKSEHSQGILAPRGWHGFETYGSNGSTLFVTPQPIKKDDLFSTDWGGFTGPVIQVSNMYGDTSGRFEVARIIARVFPAQKAFVQSVINEQVEPASHFPFGPYPKDRLTYRGDKVVEYQTPPNSEGLGTMSRLQKNSDPIYGVVILAGKASEGLSFVAVRLPPDTQGLKSTIIQQFERDNAKSLRKD